jgi:hypothetical protein
MSPNPLLSNKIVQPKLRVFLDADVIFAGSAAPSEFGASLVVLRMGEITLLECITARQAIVEVERNLQTKLPAKVPEFRLLVSRCLQVVADPHVEQLHAYRGAADEKDLPLLVAALWEQCRYFLTFKLRHYYPQSDQILGMRPGDFINTVRAQLSQLR